MGNNKLRLRGVYANLFCKYLVAILRSIGNSFLSISITSQRNWETKLAAVLLQRVSVKTGRDQSRIVPARSST